MGTTVSPPNATAHETTLRSPDNAPLDIVHPMPDLQSLQGAYIGNIERLEEHAERMSESGSDLGEEIRKLHLEQKLSDSRRSSLRSAPMQEPTRHFTSRSRNASTSSYTNSVVDVNVAARWGGYSPAGYVTSPVGSLRSGSFSQAPPAITRQRSSSKASKLGHMVFAEKYGKEGSFADQPTVPQSQRADVKSPLLGPSPRPPSANSASSLALKYDQIAQEVKDDANAAEGHGMPPINPEHLENPYADLPDRPPTAASTDTSYKLRTLWQDFDGVHCPDTVMEEEPGQIQGSGSRRSSMLRSALELPPQGVPPPDNEMVFYPAPVPKMLNLPKRLSKLPAASVQARRRTQLLDSMQLENRKSAPWLSQIEPESAKPTRKVRQSMANLPPQLRASAYFDQPAPTQEFEVKGESAEDTLNNILEASANAPVSAFTDHAFAGQLGNEVYGKEHKRKGSKANELENVEMPAGRTSISLLDTRRNSSGDLLNKLRKRSSSVDLNKLTVRASESRTSLSAELENPDPDAKGPVLVEHRDSTVSSRNDQDHEGLQGDKEEGDDIEAKEEGEEEEEQFFGAPTTLLAELQIRKQQQKSRNLTAATAFPNGIHSTLLEMDAVAEIEKRKRKGQKVNLAWEAQPISADANDSDEDVPLGVLFPGRDGLANKNAGTGHHHVSDWDRPLGLMALRELEDKEPLSRRRDRITGNSNPLRRPTRANGPQSQQFLAMPTSPMLPESEEDEGETLAQRMRRMKDKQALDDAIGPDVRKSTVSGDFAAEMLSQLGAKEEEKPKLSASPANEEQEETLGQRRARLQAEARARGDANPHGNRRPPRASMSLADVLGAHPVDPSHHQARKVSNEALVASLPQGSLLRQNAANEERLKANRLELNNRVSSYGSTEQPSAKIGAQDPKLLAAKHQQFGVGTPMSAPSMFNGQMMGGLAPNTFALDTPARTEGYLPQSNMGMTGMTGMGAVASMNYGSMNMMNPHMMNMNMGMMGMGMGYQQMSGARQPSMMNMNMGGMGMNMQQPMMAMDQPMDPRQRQAIDRWRESIMPH